MVADALIISTASLKDNLKFPVRHFLWFQNWRKGLQDIPCNCTRIVEIV